MKSIVLVQGNEYYLGKKYIYQGEFFPYTCYRDEKEKIKKYSSLKRAINACDNLNRQTDSEFHVAEIEL